MKLCVMPRFAGVMVAFVLSTTAVAAPPAGYYDSVNGLSGQALKNALHNIIDGHTVISYSAAENALKYVEEDPANTNNVLLHYKGTSVLKSSFGSAWNREHIWPQSLGADVSPKESDLHHLFAEDIALNNSRGNSVFNDVANPTSTSGDNRWTSTQFEPRDAQKGDVARAVLYMDVRYDGSDGESDLAAINTVSPADRQMGVLTALLAWNTLDPPDDQERKRNDRIDSSYQHNRNPFIDHPEYVDLIYGAQTVHDGDTLNVSVTNRAGAAVGVGSSDYPVFSLALSASPNEWDLASASLSNVGTLADNQISAVKLYLDGDNDASVSGADTLLGSGRISSANLTLALTSPYRVRTSQVNLLIAGSLSSSAPVGQTLRLRLNALTHAPSGGTDPDPSFTPVDSAAASVAASSQTGVRIVMVSTRGSDGNAAKECIVLANEGASPVALSSWQIRTRAGGDSNDTVLNLSGTVAANNYFVIASSAYGTSVEGVPASLTSSGTGGVLGGTGIGDTTGRSFGLFNSSGVKTDGFSYNGGATNPNNLHEGTAFSGAITNASTQSYQRKRSGGVYVDTAQNANDLEVANNKVPPQTSGVETWNDF